jgi:DNA-binding phage protein
MMPKSVDYHSSLIERLKDPEYAIAFIKAILEEPDPEPDLLRSALMDVATALGSAYMTPDQIQQHHLKLDQLLAQPSPQNLLELSNWLKPIGLQFKLVAFQPVEPIVSDTIQSTGLLV